MPHCTVCFAQDFCILQPEIHYKKKCPRQQNSHTLRIRDTYVGIFMSLYIRYIYIYIYVYIYICVYTRTKVRVIIFLNRPGHDLKIHELYMKVRAVIFFNRLQYLTALNSSKPTRNQLRLENPHESVWCILQDKGRNCFWTHRKKMPVNVVINQSSENILSLKFFPCLTTNILFFLIHILLSRTYEVRTESN